MLPCPFYQLTHLQCPFCGVQRGLMSLVQGDVSSWWNYNPIVWCLVPYFLILVAGEVYRPWQNKAFVQKCYSNPCIFTVMGILVVWGILRNIL